MLESHRRWGATLVLLAGLAGCSGSNATPLALASQNAARAAVPHRRDAAAASSRLMYVSDFYNNAVYALNYPGKPKERPVAVLTAGLVNPQGLCTDPAGHNVFISNTGEQNVVEYASGATTPSATYPSGGFAVGCSVDSATGILAIANVFAPATYQGSVTVCASPSACKTYVEPGGLTTCLGIAYDGSGDLYVSGSGVSGTETVYLPSGGDAWARVRIAGVAPDALPLVLQWDGRRLAMTDQSVSSGRDVLDRCMPRGATLRCDTHPVELAGGGILFIKAGGRGIVGVDALDLVTYTWAYPAGGPARKSIRCQACGWQQPAGIALLSKGS